MKKWIEAIIYAILKILCAVGVVLVAVSSQPPDYREFWELVWEIAMARLKWHQSILTVCACIIIFGFLIIHEYKRIGEAQKEMAYLCWKYHEYAVDINWEGYKGDFSEINMEQFDVVKIDDCREVVYIKAKIHYLSKLQKMLQEKMNQVKKREEKTCTGQKQKAE